MRATASWSSRRPPTRRPRPSRPRHDDDQRPDRLIRTFGAVTTAETGTRLFTEAELRERIERWASIEHGSASAGEHAVAATIADELRGLGLDVRVEEEQVHGGYWWPIGLPTALAAVAGVIGGAFAALAGL